MKKLNIDELIQKLKEADPCFFYFFIAGASEANCVLYTEKNKKKMCILKINPHSLHSITTFTIT